MKEKKLIIPLALFGFVFNLAFFSSAASPKKEKETKTEEKIIIPKEVKSVLQNGLVQRQGRQDIPLSIVKHLYLPARENVHSIFIFKMKNSDMAFVPQAEVPLLEKKEKKKTGEEKEMKETTPAKLQSHLNVFLQFYLLKNKKPVEVFKEVYIPVNFQAESTSFDPEKEEMYSIGYPLPSGDYLLAMATTSLDLKKIGTLYYEFSLPDIRSFKEKLDTTPIFFVKKITRMASPEMTCAVHKDFFTYSALQIEPNLKNVFSPGKNLDIFFFIYGTQPKDDGKYDIGVNYEVLKEEETVIRFESISYPFPLVSQPLPMKQTVIVKSEEEGEKKEKRNLSPGLYTLSIKIKDNISGKSLTRDIDFEVKQLEN